MKRVNRPVRMSVTLSLTAACISSRESRATAFPLRAEDASAWESMWTQVLLPGAWLPSEDEAEEEVDWRGTASSAVVSLRARLTAGPRPLAAEESLHEVLEEAKVAPAGEVWALACFGLVLCLAGVTVGGRTELPLDTEGRVTLSEDLREK